MKGLNIGCGDDKKVGWVNLDFDKRVNPDVVFDLMSLEKGKKLPFEKNTFDVVYLKDVIEHFLDPLPILREAYRVCKIGGIIHIKVPYGDSVWINLDHKRSFCLNSFNVHNFDFNNKDQKVNLRLVSSQLYIQPSGGGFFGNIKKFFYKTFLFLFNPIINKRPSIYDETILRYLFPHTNISVKLKKLN